MTICLGSLTTQFSPVTIFAFILWCLCEIFVWWPGFLAWNACRQKKWLVYQPSSVRPCLIFRSVFSAGLCDALVLGKNSNSPMTIMVQIWMDVLVLDGGMHVGGDNVSLVSPRLKTTSGTNEEERTNLKEKERLEVWRRYSEFDSLRTFLCTIYPHVSRACNLIIWQTCDPLCYLQCPGHCSTTSWESGELCVRKGELCVRKVVSWLLYGFLVLGQSRNAFTCKAKPSW